MLPKPFYCAPNTQPSFKAIDLSSNKIQCINSSYFAHCNWSSLKVLNLKLNQLKQSDAEKCKVESTKSLAFLKPLWYLSSLDLSGNKLDATLSSRTFEGQTNLEELNLSNMGISSHG